jgi:DnaK suppressor protein
MKKSTKRVHKTKPKATDGGSTASLFGIEPYQPKKNEEYMSEGQQHFHKILLAWKARVDVKKLTAHSTPYRDETPLCLM